MDTDQIEWIDRGDGEKLAFARRAGAGPTLVWLSGFHSDMRGTKAAALDRWAARTGNAYLRFDYSGHGLSGGRFEDGSITQWRDDALVMIDRVAQGELILVGSSMGGWIAPLCALARPERVQALVLIAPAADFTEALLWNGLDDSARAQIATQGHWMRPSLYEQPYPITRKLIEDGRAHLILGAPIKFDGPVRILQGMCDPDVPWRHAFTLVEKLTSEDVRFIAVKDGDHRLSRPKDIALLEETIAGLAF